LANGANQGSYHTGEHPPELQHSGLYHFADSGILARLGNPDRGFYQLL